MHGVFCKPVINIKELFSFIDVYNTKLRMTIVKSLSCLKS